MRDLANFISFRIIDLMSGLGVVNPFICTNLTNAYNTTVTSGGTLVLSASSSARTQFFTGTSTNTVVLPATSTCQLGTGYFFVNNSTGAVTVQTATSISVVILDPSSSVEVICISQASDSPSSWAINSSGGSVKSISSGTGLTGGPITTVGTLSLANTAVTPGSYTLSNVTVDAQGRLTSASNGTAVTSVASGTGLTGGPITTTGTLSLANTAVTPGAYTLMSGTVDAQGRLTAAASGTAVTSVASGTGLTGGPITSTGTLSLANTAVTPGSYTLASVTVDAQGRLTAASSGSAGTVTSVSSGSGLTGGPITTTGTLSIATGGVTNAMLTNSSLTVTAGTGMSGGGSVSLGGTVTLTNAGVTSFATTLSGLTVNSSTGSVSLGGTLGVGSGGTGSTTFTSGGVIYGNGASALGASAAGTSGQLLISGGAGAPTWSSTPTVTSLVITESPITNSTHAVTKAYVDAAVTNLNVHAAVYVATTSATELNAGGLPIYNNGASGVGATLTAFSNNIPLTIDGYTFTGTDVTNSTRILVKNQATQTTNGIYVFSQLQTASLPWIITRATDADNSPPGEFIQGDFNFVQTGTANANTGWVETSPGTGLGGEIVIGTDNVSYTQFSGAGTYTAGAGLNLAGTTFSVATGGVTNAMLTNSSVTVTAGTGLSGGGSVSLGGSVTLSNAGVTSIAGTAGQISASSATGASTLSLVDTAVTPGSYTLANVTVDSKGRLTAASSGSAVTSVASGTGLTGGPITSTGTLSLANTAVTPGSYTHASITVDAQGRLTAASSGTAGTVTSVASGTGLTGGPITTTGTLSLANTAVTAGSYTLGSFTVDAQGRLTAASSGSAVTSVASGTGLTGGPITSTGTLSLANTAVTAGSYTLSNITVDAQGRLTSASNGTAVTQAIGTASQVNVSAATGSVTFSLPQSIATTSSPTFQDLTLNGYLIMPTNYKAAGGIVANNTTTTDGNLGSFTSIVCSAVPNKSGFLYRFDLWADCGIGNATLNVRNGDAWSGYANPVLATVNVAWPASSVQQYQVTLVTPIAITAGSPINVELTSNPSGSIVHWNANSTGGTSNINVRQQGNNLGLGYVGWLKLYIQDQTMSFNTVYSSGGFFNNGYVDVTANALSRSINFAPSGSIGTAGQVLTINGSLNPVWATPASGTVTNVASGTGLTGGPITSTGTLSLANTAVTPGSYTHSSITVDAQGRLTSASSGTAVTSVATGTGLTGGPITSTGTISIANSGVTADTYGEPIVVVGADGRITSATKGPINLMAWSIAYQGYLGAGMNYKFFSCIPTSPTGMTPAKGTITFQSFYMPYTLAPTNYGLFFYAAGSGLANCYFGIYDGTASTLLASVPVTTPSQGSQGGPWGTSFTLTGGNTYVAALQIGTSTTTAPTLRCSGVWNFSYLNNQNPTSIGNSGAQSVTNTYNSTLPASAFMACTEAAGTFMFALN